MFDSQSTALDINELEHAPYKPKRAGKEVIAEPDQALGMALDLLDEGRPAEADRLLTAVLLEYPSDDRLWLAAGISRIRKGSFRSALAAFEMSAWLSGDGNAKELFRLYRAQA